MQAWLGDASLRPKCLCVIGPRSTGANLKKDSVPIYRVSTVFLELAPLGNYLADVAGTIYPLMSEVSPRDRVRESIYLRPDTYFPHLSIDALLLPFHFCFCNIGCHSFFPTMKAVASLVGLCLVLHKVSAAVVEGHGDGGEPRRRDTDESVSTDLSNYVPDPNTAFLSVSGTSTVWVPQVCTSNERQRI